MRPLIACGLLVATLAAAEALADLSPCNDRAAKPASRGQPVAILDRIGGDTIAAAVPIASLPFADTGTTCGAADDYDEACPYFDSVAPDVVYSFTPAITTEISVDLCGSAYDTKVYIYDESLALVACNDDHYGGGDCGAYVSYIDYAELVGRLTYYIVVDGYGTECGEYVLNVEGYEPCVVMCPPGAMLEGEPPLHDDYEDEYNGGCCGSQYGQAMQNLPGRSNGRLVFCGRSGWYLYQGADCRDTDWFIAQIGPSGSIQIRGDAEYPTYLFELGPLDCSSVGVVQSVPIGRCEEGVLTVTGEPGQEVWLWTGPTEFSAPGGLEGHEYGYVLWLDGLEPAGVTGVPEEGTALPTSWSSLKDLFR
ncbi:MAG TPA: hypothetical protein PLL30_14860 [Candidatus Krumholzibacteria bacterium]|nr:hypothetical protein [Candidatus Krumholzibacteria bacterium]HPD73049.1 hypothetical protein [Candidatus Krumholzibacteria bacterium]HRY41849.1 hypothetical protein [Candidatus Krumholzibacteria bacterium]